MQYFGVREATLSEKILKGWLYINDSDSKNKFMTFIKMSNHMSLAQGGNELDDDNPRLSAESLEPRLDDVSRPRWYSVLAPKDLLNVFE